MQNIKLGLTALALSTLLTACPATGSDRPDAGNGGETPTTPTTPTNPSTPSNPTTPAAFSLKGTVQEYVFSVDPDTEKYQVTPRAWSAGEQPVYAQAAPLANDKASEIATIATGSISKAGALNITLPSTVPDTALIDANSTDSFWKGLMTDEMYDGLTCSNSIHTDDKDAETKMSAITLEYGVPEDTSTLLLESGLPSVSVVQQGNTMTSTQTTNWIFFVYTTKDMTMKGTQNCRGTQSWEGYEAQVDYDSDINIALKRGWNQVRYELEMASSLNTTNGEASQKNKLRAVNDSSTQWYVAADNGLATPLNLPSAAFSALQ